MILLKMIDNNKKDLKSLVHELIESTNSEGVSIKEYLLSAQNKVFFEYLNSYFEEKIFENFKFIEAEVVDSEMAKASFGPNENTKSIEDFANIFGAFSEKFGAQMKDIFKLFRKSSDLGFIEKNKLFKFEAGFIDTKEKFELMMEEVLKEEIIAIDMEYYKATNNSDTDCNKILYLLNIVLTKS
jgi:hypothetical protein